MQIKQDQVTGLWCHSNGAVLMPPSGRRFKTFRWTFGYDASYGYKRVMFQRKNYFVHQIICRAFNGLPPADKPEVDHINRIPHDNRPENLRWADRKENLGNRDCVDKSIEKHGVRACEDPQAYHRAHQEAHREKYRAYSKAWYERHCEERSTYYEAHREECKARQRAYEAAKRTKMKAQGLYYTKGPDGKYGWYPRVHKSEAA